MNSRFASSSPTSSARTLVKYWPFSEGGRLDNDPGVTSTAAPLRLVGRDRELEQLHQLLDRARAGRSGALVVSGVVGVGKSALLESAVRSAEDLHQLRLVGVEAESLFAFAGLQRLLAPRLGLLDPLPVPQQRAIEVAFGLADGHAADPFLVGLATVTVLAQIAGDRPTLVVIDDAHWLDRETVVALSFTARRVDAEGVAMLFAVRPDEVDLSLFDGLDTIEVDDLAPDAAAEPTGELAAIERAAHQLGVAAESAAAERAGIISIGETVEFRHPLVRSVMYGSSPSADRRAAHEALAVAIPRDHDPDRHVGHRAAAAAGPDEAVAAELEVAAMRAGLRGGFAARAELLTRAAALSLEPSEIGRRQLDAAAAAFTAGAFRRSSSQLEEIDPSTLSHRDGARFHLVDAETVAVSGEPRASALISTKSIRAALLAGPDHPDLARSAVSLACLGGMHADRLLEDTTFDEVARVARTVTSAEDGADIWLVEAFAALVLDGFEAAVPAVRRAIDGLLDPATPDDLVLRNSLLGITVCTAICDDVARWSLHERSLRIARETGALGLLDSLIFAASMSLTVWGRLDDAEALLTEGVQLHSVLSRSSREFDIYRHSELTAWRGGDRTEIEAIFDLTVDAASSMGHGATVVTTEFARVILAISCGDYPAATAGAVDLVEHERFGMQTRVLPELVESAVRSGRLDLADEAAVMFERRALATATPYALGLLERSRALVASDDHAEARYLGAIERLAATSATADLARTHLVYGEWLRRRSVERRREHTFGSRTRCSSTWEPLGSPNALDVNWSRRVDEPGVERQQPQTNSLGRSARSPRSSQRGSPMPRSVLASTSAVRRSITTFERCSESCR